MKGYLDPDFKVSFKWCNKCKSDLAHQHEMKFNSFHICVKCAKKLRELRLTILRDLR